MTIRLRLNQGDPSEARIYYCAHYVAAALGLFAEAGIGVDYVWASEGGATVLGGQVPAVIEGTADLAIGGPMVVMRMAQDGGPSLMAFCAAVSANPWVLLARSSRPAFELSDLAGHSVCDIATIGTATMTFAWLLRKFGVEGVRLVPGSGNELADLHAVASGAVDFGLHSLHAAAEAIVAGAVCVVAELATLTGPVPWSAYIARAERLAAQPALFGAFTGAIAAALSWISVHPAEDIAVLIAPHYPGHSAAALTLAIKGYKASGTFAPTSLIDRSAYQHFSDILVDAGWLDAPVPYDRVVFTYSAMTALPSGALWTR